MDIKTLFHIKAAFEQDGSDAAYREICRLINKIEGLNNITPRIPTYDKVARDKFNSIV
jgi:hypothetical protein